MALSVDLALNARQFQAGTKDAERALEDLTDVVEDFTRDASKAGEDSAYAMDELGDAAKDAEREFDDVTDAARKTKKEIENAEDAADEFGRKAKDAGNDAKRGMDNASEGVQEFKDEANSTAREAAASFDGSAESISDVFQEVAANAFAGFGPAGAVAGLAAAAGIGLAVAGFEAMGEATEESKERAAEWAQAYIDAGGQVLSASTQAAMAQDIVTDPDRWQEAQDNAREWGVTTATAVAAMTGETWALEAAQASLNERQEDAADTSAAYTDAYGNVSLVQAGANQEISNGQQALNDINREMASGAEGADAYSQTLIAMAQNTQGATHATDEFGDSVYSLPDGTTVYVDAETGQATTDVDAIERKIYGIPDGQSQINVATGPVNASTVNNYVASSPTVRLTVQAYSGRGERIAF